MTGLHISNIRYILKCLIVKLKRIVLQSTRRGLGLLSHPLTSDSGKEALQWLSGLQCSFCNQCEFQKQTSFVRRIIFRPECLWSYEITSCFATSLINIVYCKGSQRTIVSQIFHLWSVPSIVIENQEDPSIRSETRMKSSELQKENMYSDNFVQQVRMKYRFKINLSFFMEFLGNLYAGSDCWKGAITRLGFRWRICHWIRGGW